MKSKKIIKHKEKTKIKQRKNKEKIVMRSLLLLHTRDYKIAIAMNLGEVIKLFLC